MRRRLGSSGLTITPLALGTMTWGSAVDRHEAGDHVRAFVDAGGDVVDTAYGYGGGDAEMILGSLIGTTIPRDDLVICTKAGISRVGDERRVDVSRRGLMNQLETSLARLGTDHVDLWLVHTWSDDVPLTETLSALEWAVSSGRARYVGVSNYSGWQATRAFSLLEQARVPLVANEVQYSLVCRSPEAEVAPAAAALGFGLLAWSPLGRGVLTGKYRHGIPSGSRAASPDFPNFAQRFLDEHSARVTDALAMAARGLGVGTTEVALAWVRDRTGVAAPIVGVRTVAQLRTALKSLDLTLPEEIVAALDDVSLTD
ncbi:aldo/keto reductase [Intrasporangium oryzae NRRL B-24470]|uniref:Aldo/keto reductase n=1 Tax=Intrasporangium oryzae NRRL B-24470 TaxID=1386089 RepID=W9GD34_9MICO|nr:aldo/keto reductase [Intrasporangium oryzae]EWT01774.1 aldo/keto reductase [Intrasporangium oryzae NRRL B-24470]